MSIKFDATATELDLMTSIAYRADREIFRPLGIEQSLRVTTMDLDACHSNGCPLDLEGLLHAPASDFGHDIAGIRRHIDRTTGKLQDCFLPRCAKGGNTP